MKYDIIYTEAKKQFAEWANPEIVKKYSRYFREGYDAYGLVEGQLTEYSKQVLEKYPEMTVNDILKLGDTLFADGKYEMGSLAYLLLYDKKKQFDASTIKGVKRWFDRGVSNWAHSDVLCSKITPIFFEKKILTFQDLKDWRTSDSRWTRRAVPVTLLALRKTEAPGNLLSFIEPMILDKERVVHQGLGWFLREVWKIHPREVEDILFTYKNTAARLIIQYATEKMTKEQKARFAKDKKKA
ncbi:MAG TPA: DNA alkylation repair protein [Candidatus Cloacimonadota bacterium]|nr:DNA alkylation repair protein [Candidatus Cloacimonadota bacterium]